MVMSAFSKSAMGKSVKIVNVTLMGVAQEVKWKLNDEGLIIHPGIVYPDDIAQVYKIETE